MSGPFTIKVRRAAASSGYLLVAFTAAAATATTFTSDPSRIALYSAVFTVTLTIMMVIHETGHAVAGTIVGMQVRRIGIGGARMRVEFDNDDLAITNRQMFISAFAGPAAEAFAAGWVLVATATTHVLEQPAMYASLLGLIEAAANLLLPVRGLDGHHIAVAGRRMLNGQGRRPYYVPELQTEAATP